MIIMSVMVIECLYLPHLSVVTCCYFILSQWCIHVVVSYIIILPKESRKQNSYVAVVYRSSGMDCFSV